MKSFSSSSSKLWTCINNVSYVVTLGMVVNFIKIEFQKFNDSPKIENIQSAYHIEDREEITVRTNFVNFWSCEISKTK